MAVCCRVVVVRCGGSIMGLSVVELLSSLHLRHRDGRDRRWVALRFARRARGSGRLGRCARPRPQTLDPGVEVGHHPLQLRGRHAVVPVGATNEKQMLVSGCLWVHWMECEGFDSGVNKVLEAPVRHALAIEDFLRLMHAISASRPAGAGPRGRAVPRARPAWRSARRTQPLARAADPPLAPLPSARRRVCVFPCRLLRAGDGG